MAKIRTLADFPPVETEVVVDTESLPVPFDEAIDLLFNLLTAKDEASSTTPGDGLAQSGVTQDGAGPWPDGAVVIQSASGCWDGKSWVPGWGAAKKYRPCTPDVEAAIAEVERATGQRCWPFYVQGD